MPTPVPALTPGLQNQVAGVHPAEPSGLGPTCPLSGREGIGSLDRAFATLVSPWLSQPPQARRKEVGPVEGGVRSLHG